MAVSVPDILLHLAAAIIRGVPVGMVLFGALLMLVTILAISNGQGTALHWIRVYEIVTILGYVTGHSC